MQHVSGAYGTNHYQANQDASNSLRGISRNQYQEPGSKFYCTHRIKKPFRKVCLIKNRFRHKIEVHVFQRTDDDERDANNPNQNCPCTFHNWLGIGVV